MSCSIGAAAALVGFVMLVPDSPRWLLLRSHYRRLGMPLQSGDTRMVAIDKNIWNTMAYINGETEFTPEIKSQVEDIVR